MALSSDQQYVLKEIFSDEPVRTFGNFVVSTAFESRLSINPRGKLTDTLVKAERYRSPHFNAEHLGPYENGILRGILEGYSRLVVFRSGTGSGKSSLIWFLKDFVDRELARAAPRADLPVKQLVSILNFDALPNEFTEELNPHLHVVLRKERQSAMRDELANRLGHALLDNLTSGLVEKDRFLYEVVMSALGRRTNEQNGVASVLSTLNRHIAKKGWQGTSGDLQELILQVADPHARILLWLCIWEEVSLLRPFEIGSFPLVLVVDNIDQMATYLQRDLLDILGRFYRDRTHGKGAFKIVFMMRLASASDKYARAMHFDEMAPHNPPDTVDMLATRALHFLLHQDTYESFRRLNSREAEDLHGRIEKFCLLLLDRDCDMRKLLRGFCGTNLRLANTQARKWICSPTVDRISLTRSVHWKENVLQKVLPNTLIKLGRAIGRSLQDLLANHMIDASDLDDKGVFTDICAQMAQRVQYVLVHSRLIPGVRTRYGLRCWNGDTIGTFVSSQIEGSPEKLDSVRHRLVDELATLFRDTSFTPRIGGSTGLEKVIEELRSSFQDKVENSLFEQLHPASNALCQFMCKLVIDAFQKAMIEAELDGVRAYIHSIQFPSHSEEDPILRVVRGSRYLAARILFDRDLGSELAPEDYTPINLFSGGDGEISLAPLYILYRIAEDSVPSESPSVITYLTLQKDAQAMGYGRKLGSALKELIRRDRRLVFGGVDDEAKDVDAWKEAANVSIHLSWAGLLCYRNLVEVPTYLQWALGGVKGLKARFGWKADEDSTAVERLVFVFSALEALLEEEKRHLQALVKSRPDYNRRSMFKEYGFSLRGPAADIFFRATPAFLMALRNSIESRRGRSADPRVKQDIESAKGLLARWVKSLGPVAAWYREMYGDVPRKWEEVITWEQQLSTPYSSKAS